VRKLAMNAFRLLPGPLRRTAVRLGWFGLDELPDMTAPTADILRSL
jgi:hypothetical protein